MRFVESHNMIIFASANVSYCGRYTYRHRAHDNAFQLLAGGRQQYCVKLTFNRL